MPTLTIYLQHEIYKRLTKLADEEGVSISKACALIVESYFKYLKAREIGSWREEDTESSTKAT